MMAKRRKHLISLAILVLVALNLWRWWPANTASSVDAALMTSHFNIEDFEVRAIPDSSLKPFSRDIFNEKNVMRSYRPVKAASAPVQHTPEKSPEELARDNAQIEFAQIRCVGVSVRNERMQAYLINAGEPLLVSNGDKVGSRFFVEKIVSDGVSLRDAETGVGGLITISGK